MLQVIRTHDVPKNPYIPLFLPTILGLAYYVPLVIRQMSISGGAYVISNQDPRCTQKPMYSPIFTHHIRS